MPFTRFETALRGWTAYRALAYREQDARRFDAAADMGMFFRTGADICARVGASYTGKAGRTPKFVLADADTVNAYALWIAGTGQDWVVATTGLLDRLVDLGQCVAQELWRLQDAPAFTDRFSRLSSALKDEEDVELLGLAIAHMSFVFLVGHELGHHTCGHDALLLKDAAAAAGVDELAAGYARKKRKKAGRASPGSFDTNRPEFLSQAREMAADHVGIGTLLRHMRHTKIRASQQPIEGNTARSTAILDAILGDDDTSLLMIGGAALMALAALKPGSWKPRDLQYVEHPFPSVRAFAMILVLHKLITQQQIASDNLWGMLSLFSVPLAREAFPADRVNLNPTVQEAQRMIMRSWSRLGINDAVYRPKLMAEYLDLLQASWAQQREACRPAWRVPDPEPLIGGNAQTQAHGIPEPASQG